MKKSRTLNIKTLKLKKLSKLQLLVATAILIGIVAGLLFYAYNTKSDVYNTNDSSTVSSDAKAVDETKEGAQSVPDQAAQPTQFRIITAFGGEHRLAQHQACMNDPPQDYTAYFRATSNITGNITFHWEITHASYVFQTPSQSVTLIGGQEQTVLTPLKFTMVSRDLPNDTNLTRFHPIIDSPSGTAWPYEEGPDAYISIYCNDSDQGPQFFMP